MIIANLHIEGVPSLEPETDTPLVIYRYAVLALTVAFEHVKPVSRGDAQVANNIRGIYAVKFPQRSRHNLRRDTFRNPLEKQLLSMLVGKRFNHKQIVMCHVTIVNNRTRRGGQHSKNDW